MSDAPQSPRLAYTVEEAGEELSLSRSRIYELIASGDLASVKIGRSRRIRHEALVAYLDSLSVAS